MAQLNRMIDINLAFSTDLVVTDALRFYTGKGPVHNVIAETGLTIVGSNRVAADAVAVCIIKQHNSTGWRRSPSASTPRLRWGRNEAWEARASKTSC